MVAWACDKGAPDKPTPVQPAPPPSVADAAVADAPAFTGTLDELCVIARALMDRAVQCASRSADFLREVRDGLPVDPPGTPLSARESTAAMCANTALHFDDELVRALPTCRLTRDERVRTEAFIATYYGRRTKPRPTGDAEVDKNLSELAATRDALCACPDEECLRAAEKAVTAAVKPVPRELTNAMEDGVAISDEVSRCAERIKDAAADRRRAE